jgi:hypothetical protein
MAGADVKRFLSSLRAKAISPLEHPKRSLRAATVPRALACVRRLRLKPPALRVGLWPPNTSSGMRLWRLERAVVGRPCSSSVRTANPVSSRAAHPSPVSPPVDHRCCERRAVRQAAGLDTPPQGHAPLACERDHPAAAESATAVATARLIPRRQRTRGRHAEPAPGHRKGPGAEVVIAGFGEATRLGGVPTRRGRGRHAAGRPDFFALAQGPPAAAVPDTDPGPRGPKPLEGQAVPHGLPRRRRGRRQPRAAFGVPRGHALGQRRHGLPRLAETVAPPRRERRALPPAKGRQRLREGAAGGPHEALGGEPSLQAVEDPRPIPWRGRSGARALTAIVCLQTREPHATPSPLLPSAITPAPGAPLRDIEAIRLRSTVTPIDCTAGRVPHDGLHPLRHSTAVAPEPIPAGLVTTDDAGVIRSATPPLGLSHLLTQAGDVPGATGPCSWPLRHPGRDTPFPGRDAECKGQQPGRPVCRGLSRLARRWWSQRSPPSCVVQPMGFAAV